jgi:alanine racemase
MAMVKAFAYGGGIREIAQTLAYYRVDYFGVAYPDEGVVLRQAGILDVPIMVMNPNPASFEQLRQFRLEPAVSNWAILEALIAYLSPLHLAPFPIQLEIDTGMRRLGFEAKDTALLLDFLEKAQNVVKVVGIFSHLASSESAQDDAFTLQQFALFEEFTNLYERRFGAVCKHMLNSSGIVRWAQKSYDMVRLGIGLYGIDATLSYSNELQTVASLQTVISQIKTLNPSESVGYNRRGRTSAPTRVATIAIGYADGFLRAFGQGRGFVWVNGRVCPTIGTVCMDMAFVDLGDTPAEVGDVVQIFGKDLPIESVAQYIGTIPYEILTNISERVPRVFYE